MVCTVEGSVGTSISNIAADRKPELEIVDNVVNATSTLPCDLYVYSPDGRCVARTKRSSMNLNSLPAGVYIVTAQNAQGSTNLKVAVR